MGIENNFGETEFRENEFDNWLSLQLKNSAVEPSSDFTQKVVANVIQSDAAPRKDLFLLYLFAGLSLLITVLICVAYVIPHEWLELFRVMQLLSRLKNIETITFNFSLFLLAGSGFFILDNIMERVTRNKQLLQG